MNSAEKKVSKDFGSVKSALNYCVEMDMNQTQSAEFLSVTRWKVRAWSKLYGVNFPCGYKTRDTTLLREVQRIRVTEANLNGTMGTQVRKSNRSERVCL